MSDYNSEKNRFVWADIPVADLKRAAAFYTAVMGVKIHLEKFGDVEFGVVDHQDGNGGCLVVKPGDITEKGPLLYVNADGRIRDAVAKAQALGGKVKEPIASIGPHGFRAVLLDSEGNKIGLHSNTDK